MNQPTYDLLMLMVQKIEELDSAVDAIQTRQSNGGDLGASYCGSMDKDFMKMRELLDLSAAAKIIRGNRK